MVVSRLRTLDPRGLSLLRQVQHENNEIVATSLEKVLWLYKQSDAFVIDRSCKFQKESESRPNLKQLKYYIIDKCHAKKGHNKKCKCPPYNHAPPKKRLKGVNNSICEQTFSWFRGYASTLNELHAQRHRFIVLYFASKHNKLVDAGDLKHLNAYTVNKTRKRKATKGYHCNK